MTAAWIWGVRRKTFPLGERLQTNGRAFTLIEVLVVVAIIALLLAALIPSLARAREVSRRSVCMSNEHQLSLAWMIYATDNRGSLVSSVAHGDEGTTDRQVATTPGWYNNHAPGWVRGVSWTYSPEQWRDEWQREAIRKGALYKYVKSMDAYRCPATRKNELITYGMSIPLGSSYQQLFPFAVSKGCWVKRQDEIQRPAERFNFIDYILNDPDFAWITRDANDPRFWPIIVAGHYTEKLSGRHTKGTVFAFCDGHAEYWKWSTADMARFCVNDYSEHPPSDFSTKDMRGDWQFVKLSRALWGHRFDTGWWQ